MSHRSLGHLFAASLLLVLSPLSSAAHSEKDAQWHVVGTINGKASDAWLVQFSRDGKRLLAGFGDQNKPEALDHVRLFDSRTLEPLTPALPAANLPAAQPWVSRDGENIVVADGTRLSIFDSNGKLRRSFPCGAAAVGSADGTRVATVNGESFGPANVSVWEVGSGRRLLSLHDEHCVERVIFTDAGHLLAVEWWSTRERRYRVLDIAAGGKDCFAPLNPPLNPLMTWNPGVTPIAVSPDGGRFAVFDSTPDSHFVVYDSKTGRELARGFASGMVTSAAFSTDGKSILLDRYGALGLYDPASGRPKGAQLLPGQSHQFDDRFALSRDGRFVIAYGRGAGVWDLKTGKLVLNLGQPTTCAYAFSPDGRLAFMDEDGKITLWSRKAGDR